MKSALDGTEECLFLQAPRHCALNPIKILAPVVQTLDSAIRRINNYPADKYYGN